MRTHLKIALSTFLILSFAGTFSWAAIKLRHAASIYLDVQEKGLKRPEGIACGGDGTLVVADTGNGRLLRYTLQNNVLQGGQGMTSPQLTYPVRVQIDTRGNILALDEKQRRIVRLSSTGEFKGYLEPVGMKTSATIVPRSFKIDGSGAIYILDVFSENVMVLDNDGKFLKTISFPKEYGFISDLAVDSAGTVYLLDSVKSAIYSAAKEAKKFTPLTQSMKENVLFPTSLTTDGRGTLYLVDQNGGDIVIVGQDGSFQGRQSSVGWKEGMLRYPSQACVTESGELVIADRDNNRVQIFSIVP